MDLEKVMDYKKKESLSYLIITLASFAIGFGWLILENSLYGMYGWISIVIGMDIMLTNIWTFLMEKPFSKRMYSEMHLLLVLGFIAVYMWSLTVMLKLIKYSQSAGGLFLLLTLWLISSIYAVHSLKKDMEVEEAFTNALQSKHNKVDSSLRMTILKPATQSHRNPSHLEEMSSSS